MAEASITHPNLSLVTFSGNHPKQTAGAFCNSRENKKLFSMGKRLAHADQGASYDKRQIL